MLNRTMAACREDRAAILPMKNTRHPLSSGLLWAGLFLALGPTLALGVTRPVSDYFAYPDDGIDDTDEINNAITAAKDGDVVTFAAGTYDLKTRFDDERYLKISSKTGITLQGATSNGAPATKLLRHVNVEAMASPPRIFYLFNSTRVTISGFIFDNTPHLCTTGTVTAIDPAGKYVRVQIPAGLPMEAGQPCYAANLWEPSVDELKSVANVSANSSPANWTIHDATNRIMELNKSTGLTFLANTAVGDRLSWHYGWNGRSQLEVAKSNTITLDNLVVRNAINMALLIGSTHDLTLSKIVMKPEGAQLPVGPRDGIHISRCTGTVNISDLEITGVRMDGLVVRTPYADIASIASTTQFNLLTELATSGQTIPVGSSVTFFSSTGNPYVRLVAAATYNGDSGGRSSYTITTQTDLPSFAAVGTEMKLGGLMPASVAITDSTFKNIAGSALILFTDDITVDNLTATKVMFPAIHLGDNSGSGVCGYGITIRNSTFDRCGWMPKPESGIPGIITLAAINDTFTTPKLRDVTIETNTFRTHLASTTNPAVNAFDTDGLTLTDNVFENVRQPVLIAATSVTGDSVATSDVIVDNDNNTVTHAEATGSFGNSGLTGYNASKTRFSSSTGAKATWTVTPPRTGSYDVYVYKIVHSTSDSNAKISVTHSGGTGVTYVNYTTGTSGWHKVGTYTFTGGTDYTISNERSNGYLRTDAVMLMQL